MQEKLTYRTFSQVPEGQVISFHKCKAPSEVFELIVWANKPSKYYDFCITLSDCSVHSFNLRKDNYQYEDAVEIFDFWFAGDKYYGVIKE